LTRSIAVLASVLFLWDPPAPAAQAATTALQSATPAVAARPAVHPDTILYGVAYYHEYMPYERLDKDIELMTRAGITVVRVGESTWTSWEPREGEFQFEWMDRIVSKMQAAGIKVVMGTPTYSVPPWLYAKHPEIMVVPRGQVRTPREFYGMRQNMDISHPVFRQYSERIIRKIAERYGKHPGVIGWQIDNETGAYGTTARRRTGRACSATISSRTVSTKRPRASVPSSSASGRSSPA
jgi:beta-galactosidase